MDVDVRLDSVQWLWERNCDHNCPSWQPERSLGCFGGEEAAEQTAIVDFLLVLGSQVGPAHPRVPGLARRKLAFPGISGLYTPLAFHKTSP